MTQFARKVYFQPAYDRRDPNPSKNYGIHGVHICFEVKNLEASEGVTFSVSTNWQLPNVQAEIDSRPQDPRFPYLSHKPQPFGVDIHTKTPQYPNQTPARTTCELTGGVCYCDGSGLLGDSFFQTLVEKGDDALFTRMEEQYFLWKAQK